MSRSKGETPAQVRSRYQLRLVRENTAALAASLPSKVIMRTPRDVAAFMTPIAEPELVENFWILPLDAQHATRAPILITRGILCASLVAPREVFRAAIAAGAACLILVHNHPSGDPTPSPEDRIITDQLRAAGKLLDIPVYDHVILGDARYVSMAEAGLL